jgi:transposase-like protein
MVALQKFKTLIDLLAYFNDEQICRDYLEKIRWEGKLECPYKDCHHTTVYKYSDGKHYKCAKCDRKYTVKVGTIFEDSKVPLQKWFAGIYLITAHKKGISSLQLHRDIGVTQKTAWFMLHRVRHSLGLKQTDAKLSGVCEADETFMGGKEANKHASKKTPNNQGRSVKTRKAVAGVIQRGGELRAQTVPNTKGEVLKPFVIGNIAFGSELNTDEWWGYKGLNNLFEHNFVRHNSGEYVQGDCHTNSLEGFWSLLKRGVNGIYHSISGKHLQQYIDEFVFRYNTRTYSENYRFDMMLNQISSRLTYKQLITQ